MEKECRECGGRFEAVLNTAKYCGDRCKMKWYRKHKGGEKELSTRQKIDAIYELLIKKV